MYINPVVDADWPDLDVIATDDGFLLVASSFTRSPGLPLLWSENLVDWQLVGHGLQRNLPLERFERTQPGGGVWAPAVRRHHGLYRIYWADPDEGVWTVQAERPEGPWSEPVLVLPGTGIIDPCPLWDEDGRVWLVHGWAKSRSGIDNRLDLVELDAEGLCPVGRSRVLVDGDAIEGCKVLEGPKLYRARGSYWLFAPAGGVATGWQYVFRAERLEGPWEHRVVLAQGSTAVNGPHQGAWVTTPAGEDWFLHFQDRGWAGRVVHLQPMAWDAGGWPVVGSAGEPVARHIAPAGLPAPRGIGPAVADEWTDGIGAQWAWQANPPDGGGWGVAVQGVLELPAVPAESTDPRVLGHVLAQPLPGSGVTLRTDLALRGATGASGGIVVLGCAALTCTIESRDGAPPTLVIREWANEEPRLLASRTIENLAAVIDLTVRNDGRCDIVAEIENRREVLVSEWQAVAGRWVGAAFGLYSVRNPTGGAAALRVGPVARV